MQCHHSASILKIITFDELVFSLRLCARFLLVNHRNSRERNSNTQDQVNPDGSKSPEATKYKS